MRGGKREGAGRKPGAATRLGRAAREAAQSTGEMPHEFLLRVARGEGTFLDRADKGTATFARRPPTLAERLEAAKAAAPYFAPRLAATELHHEGTLRQTPDLSELITPEQMERFAREILLEHGYVFDD